MNQPVSGGQNDKFAVSKLLPDSNILEITFTFLRYLFWFAVLCAILLCML